MNGFRVAVVVVLVGTGCSPAPRNVRLAEPLGPEEEKRAIESFQKAWTGGEANVREQPPTSPPAGN